MAKPITIHVIVGLLVAVASCTRSGDGNPVVPERDSRDAAASGDHGGPSSIRLRDWTDQSGVDFVHTDGGAGQHYIVETVSGGFAIFDYDGDGLLDLYFPNGSPLPDRAPSDTTARHALFRNLGGMKFRDVTSEAGVACTSYGMGVAIGDFDNDGYCDIYLSNFGPNRLYHNDGDGTFTEVPDAGGMSRGDRVGAGACFVDIDADGDLDLFAANYVQFSFESHRPPPPGSRNLYPGPLDHPAETNCLFRNEGDGSWTDISVVSGVAAKRGTGMGVISFDMEGDGDSDICVANDEMANFAFRNDGAGNFEEVGIFAGIAYNQLGTASGSMGIDCGDYDRDGRLDLYVTAFHHERASLYRNEGDAFFQDVSPRTGAGEGTDQNVTWGCCLADLDNDSDNDLYVASGHLDHRDGEHVYNAPDLVLRSQLAETGTAKFTNVSKSSGNGPLLEASSRGAAVGDFDHDGDLDVVVLNMRQPAAVLRNESEVRAADRHWLQIDLKGVSSNRHGVGARVTVTSGELVMVDEVHSGRGYQSHWGTRLHFGLGANQKVDRIAIQWLGGASQVVGPVAANQVVTIREGDAPITQ